MINTIIKPGQYKIDYLNRPMQGTSQALAFYIRGEGFPQISPSRQTKRLLMIGLYLLQQNHLDSCLVAVYMDIQSNDDSVYTGFEYLLRDFQRGLFKRVFTLQTACLMENPVLWQQLSLQADSQDLIHTLEESYLLPLNGVLPWAA